MTHDVFISYSSKEKIIADGICHFLEANDVEQPAAKEKSHETLQKVRCNMECRVFIDGEERATAKPGSMAKIPLHKGEYVVMVSGMDGLDYIEQVFTMPDGDKLLSFDMLALKKERLSIEKAECEKKANEEAELKEKETVEESTGIMDKALMTGTAALAATSSPAVAFTVATLLGVINQKVVALRRGLQIPLNGAQKNKD